MSLLFCFVFRKRHWLQRGVKTVVGGFFVLSQEGSLLGDIVTISVDI